MKLPPLVTWSLLFLVATVLGGLPSLAAAQAPADTGWPRYGNDSGGGRYSALAQINRSNVSKLRWRGRIVRARSSLRPAQHEGRIRGHADSRRAQAVPQHAIQPGHRARSRTGTRLWEHDSARSLAQLLRGDVARRLGLARTRSPRLGRVRLRIFVATLDARLIALDGATGTPCGDFGVNGRSTSRAASTARLGQYHVIRRPRSPGTRHHRLLHRRQSRGRRGARHRPRLRRPVGCFALVLESGCPGPTRPRRAPAPATRGRRCRSMRARTRLRPDGEPSPDHFGGVRRGDNRWANSVVALRAATGELVWGFQVVHHESGTTTSPAQPTLYVEGRQPAIAVNATKMGRSSSSTGSPGRR